LLRERGVIIPRGAGDARGGCSLGIADCGLKGDRTCQSAIRNPQSENQLTFCGFGAPSGPLSQSCAEDTFGRPHCFPFQPSKPSILNAQNPVWNSPMTMRPSAFRTSTPKAPL